jgi:asparagine synthase (glutamine-hydrolysing)
VNLQAIDVFLAYAYVPHPLSAFDGINKLPPAHYLTFRQGQVSLSRYWQLDYTPRPISEAQALAELPEILQEAVNLRMISERPLGAFLSGGVDSSLVTALMTKVSTQQVKTYSIGFEDPRYDERKWSQKVAAHLGTDHTELVVKPDVVDVVHKLTDYFDEPFADSSAIPSYYVAKMAREHVVVVLNGDGGDEAFGGYPRYALAAAFQQFAGLHSVLKIGRPLIGLAARSLNQRRLKRLNEVLANSPQSLIDSYRFPMTYATLTERNELWQQGIRNKIDTTHPITIFENWWSLNPTVAGPQTMLSVDVESYLPGDLLPKVDITTMSQSLEARSPLLDQKVMEYAAHLPYALKVKGMNTKIILKQVARKFLPNDVIDRPKMGFGIPRAEWLRGPLADLVNDSLLASDSYTSAWFNRDQVQSIIKGHMSGTDKDLLLWPLLTLELWARRWLRT